MKKTVLPFLLALFTALLSIGLAALDTVYVNDGGTGDGSSAASPLGSMTAALDAVKDGGKIIISESITLDEPIFEPTHENAITVSGGQLIFNQSPHCRWYLGGPTTFENTTVAYGEKNSSKSAMIVARYNPLTLGQKVTTSVNTLILVGGCQYPLYPSEQPTANDADTQITVNSGTVTAVIGFTRGTGSETLRGTSHITVNGGTVKSIYGASVHGQYAGSTDITVNGGKIGKIYTGGDSDARRLNGNAKITVNGGSVGSLIINNVMGRTDVYYLGGSLSAVTKQIGDANQKYLTSESTLNLVVRKGIRAVDMLDLFDTAKYEDGSKVSSIDAAVAEYTLLDKKPEKSRATTARVYLSNAGNGDGMTPETAVSDIAAAYGLLDGVDGTIVVINEFKLPSGFTEPKHENKIVITSYDGERYFDGGLDFGSRTRFYFSGDTTFENTRFAYTSSMLFVGNFHNICFGTGLEMPETVVGQSSLYVASGYQFGMEGPVNVNVGGRLTVESGHYYCFIGYTRGMPAGGVQYAFKGTQTIDFYGGDVYRVYGGPAQANTGDNVVFNQYGGEVTDAIFLGGDQFYYSNNATVNIMGGKVNRLCLRNVIGKTEVNWTGGEIASMEKVYGKNADGTVDVSTLAGGASYSLQYKNVTPSAEMLALFDTVGTDPASPSPASKFTASRTYRNQFTDVAENQWFYPFVKTAFAYTLANGTSDTKFSPDGKFTVAQALTAAVNIHKAYNGTTVRAAAAGEAWYVPYVEYCVANGIIKDGQFADLNANIKRGDMAIVFANILPESEYKAIREKTLPDMTAEMHSAAAVQKLANAGIVGGDAKGNFNPDNEITRAEACVIFTRIAVAEMRDAK